MNAGGTADPVLFLGGSLDGQRLRVPAGRRRDTIRAMEVRSSDREDEVYYLQKLRGGQTMFEVYALAGWDGDAVMRRLIDGQAV